MIRNSVKLLLTLCILIVGGGVVANAQIDADTHVQADVPFAFVVNVVFQTVDAQTPDDQPLNTTELVFDRLGNRYFLSQVWESGSATGADLPKSRMEKRLADSGIRPDGQSTVAALKR